MGEGSGGVGGGGEGGGGFGVGGRIRTLVDWELGFGESMCGIELGGFCVLLPPLFVFSFEYSYLGCCFGSLLHSDDILTWEVK